MSKKKYNLNTIYISERLQENLNCSKNTHRLFFLL